MLGIIPHPSVPNLVYARTDVGGVYKFNFSGQNWVSLSDSLPVANQFSGMKEMNRRVERDLGYRVDNVGY